MRRIKARCPDRLVAVNNHGSNGVPSGSEHAGVDLLNYHPGGGETDQRQNASRPIGTKGRKAVPHPEVAKAILSDTDGYHPGEMGGENDAEIRKFAWSSFVNGQHFGDMSHAGRTDKLMHCPPLPTFKYILPFVNQVDFVHAQSHPELILESADGDLLANPGKEYVVYLRSGGTFRLNLSHAKDILKARWYNPRSGEWSKPFEVTPSGNVLMTCPDNNDWVLLLKV